MLAWPGSEGMDEFDSRMDDRAKTSRIGCPPPVKKGKGGEDLWDSRDIDAVLPYWLAEEWRNLMPVETKMIEEQTAEVGRVIDRYQVVVREFRATVKNDISSVKASAVATEETVNRIGKAYKETAAMLITPNFVRALENAERMAAALKAISELQSHSITFAVLDRKPQS